MNPRIEVKHGQFDVVVAIHTDPCGPEGRHDIRATRGDQVQSTRGSSMSDVNDTLGQAGGGEQIDALGQVWILSHVGPGIRARYAARVKAKARRELAAEKPLMGEIAYREACNLLQEQINTDAYNWGSPLDPNGMGSAIQAMMASPLGQAWLLQELLRPAHGDVAMETIVQIAGAAPEETQLALAACLGIGPNRQAPTERTTSGSEASNAD